jgi:hypothetical protein
MKLTGENRNTWGKTRPSATLSTTHPTWTDPESNPGLRVGRSATNRLSHATAFVSALYHAIRLNLEEASYQVYLDLFSSRLISENVKIKCTIYDLPRYLYGCRTSFVSFTEEHRYTVTQNIDIR